jgi:DNA-binding NarL/FixJ family response regulator
LSNSSAKENGSTMGPSSPWKSRPVVMVVEDQTLVALDIADELRAFGYEAPPTAGSGEDAVGKAREIQPDLILMDIRLEEEMETELRKSLRELGEHHIALKVLIERNEGYRLSLEKALVTNLKTRVGPTIKSLKQSRLSAMQQTMVDLIENDVAEITSPFVRNLIENNFQLTFQETRIAVLVKQGKTTKEIAAILKSSPRAIEFHRHILRKKIGMAGKPVSLEARLAGFDPPLPAEPSRLREGCARRRHSRLRRIPDALNLPRSNGRTNIEPHDYLEVHEEVEDPASVGHAADSSLAQPAFRLSGADAKGKRCNSGID